ncbi:sulfite exporter TauE/SafE family protein [Tuanshanicoccus lijuaniae]|nr:sulfite exporter TauE/SafE family protein [Aerococcaceae bacterium zg-1292]MBF6978197.1 sulfite exporter TauE/SafE family protein [Aerococcaceae bacterium zg-BR22]MBS4456415.1 sulfite exporter TauE/SafE family protein [Aerococcaceae bacterium zg-A91]MBS4458265.1 sulfite exporter TauE/SafE family protein [Aerococcaceae bacterium zg-BR33]QQA38128.1 sulfite exporter TauE/SafE family protein [Aerococcaceae bacterium zg-1292]
MGGGVIIKPLLDLIGTHDVVSISFYSSIAVFIMSIVSTYRQLRNGIKINIRLVISVSIGAIVGGVLGNRAFSLLLIFFNNKDIVQMIQIVIITITLFFSFCYSKYKLASFKVRGNIWYFLCGVVLGFLASLLGIGGGPINVSLLMLLFSTPIKDATVYSICTIFFSQLSKLSMLFLNRQFFNFDLTMLYYIAPAAIIGGFLGASLSKFLSSEKVELIFQVVVLSVIAINVYNGYMLLAK